MLVSNFFQTFFKLCEFRTRYLKVKGEKVCLHLSYLFAATSTCLIEKLAHSFLGQKLIVSAKRANLWRYDI